MRICEYAFLNRMEYAEAHARQEAIAAARKAGECEDALLLLEHPHVITLGRAANRDNVLADENARRALGVELHETGRGGDVTYHGPGQLVGYPIINLAPDRCDVRRYVQDLEEVLIRTAGDYGIEAERIAGLTGVWVGGEKLAAIGVRISRWVTMHGFALNVSTDLSRFNLIIPCGISDHGVTSIEKLLGRKVSVADAAAKVVRHFGEIFNRRMIERPALAAIS
ncbi:MAG: lipoyl(octanoyl) transferase LipB [Acidobacteria bacterium]|nr:lipoyl(octanoyl) transferase LipB [Acidobacteriota bacterium]